MSLAFFHFDSDAIDIVFVAITIVLCIWREHISTHRQASHWQCFSHSRYRQIGPQNPFVSITITDTLLTNFIAHALTQTALLRVMYVHHEL